ncbi:ribonuclease H family protein, partial [Streptomyces sp. IBSBF 2390]|uniref:ribonuclease H family protein n=1 Tax=Streptomyces sp. IBSBF 2390 TaxID=2903533 RepID=UPI002FDBA5A1
MGAVLSQEIDGQEKVIGYFSKSSKTERNYCVTRKELLAVVESVKYFHKYLYGNIFILELITLLFVGCFNLKRLRDD